MMRLIQPRKMKQWGSLTKKKHIFFQQIRDNIFFLYICEFNLQFMISEKIQFVLYIWGCVSEIQHLNLCDFLNQITFIFCSI